jgi:hypothetical protein
MNGFDDLERQLRGKVAARAGRRRRPLMRTLAVAAVLSVSAGAVTAAATGVIGGPGTEEAGVALLDDVMRATEDVPVCRLHGPDRRPAEITSLPASDAALRAFPALRRPATAHERAFARRSGRMTGMTRVLSGGARELRATDGTRFMLLITAGRGRGLGRDPDCIPVQRAELERRAPGLDADVVAVARGMLDDQERAYRANLGREGLMFDQLGDDGRLASGGGTFTDAAIELGTGSISTVRVHDRPRLAIAGLVPAAADHVVVRSRSHPGKASIRIAVPQQVFHLVLPARFGTHVSVEWHAPDGALLHVLKLLW